jgi:hypothetical protein
VTQDHRTTADQRITRARRAAAAWLAVAIAGYGAQIALRLKFGADNPIDGLISGAGGLGVMFAIARFCWARGYRAAIDDHRAVGAEPEDVTR